jgi:hypothetical protein
MRSTKTIALEMYAEAERVKADLEVWATQKFPVGTQIAYEMGGHMRRAVIKEVVFRGTLVPELIVSRDQYTYFISPFTTEVFIIEASEATCAN